MASIMSQSYHENETHFKETGEEELHVPSTSRKRPLAVAGQSRPKPKKQRTVIAIDDIKVVAPPKSSQTSTNNANLSHPTPRSKRQQQERGDGSNSDIEMSSSSSDDDDSSTSSQDTVPPPSGEATQHNDPSDDKEWAVNRLDKNLARLEEKQIMETLDRDISRHEEKEIMQFLLKKVYKAEDFEYIRSLPCLVKQEGGGYAWKVKEQAGEQKVAASCIPDSWKLRKRRRKLRRRSTHNGKSWVSIGNVASEIPCDTDESMTRVDEISEVDCKMVRQSLPKWITPMQPFEDRQRLFSRPQFMRCVVLEIEKQMPSEIVSNSCLWNVLLSETHPVEGVNQYYLEARAPVNHLEILRQKTADFVRACIFQHNRRALLADSESLLVDVSLSLNRSGALGLTLARNSRLEKKDAGSGVYVSRAASNSRFCQLLGGKMAYGEGCALVGINGEKILSVDGAVRLINRAKQEEEEQEKRGSFPRSKVTVCVSKYADFSQSIDPSALTFRNMDGSIADPEIIGEARLERYLARKGPPPDCWVEYNDDEDVPHNPNTLRFVPSSKSESKAAYHQIMEDDNSVEISLVLSGRDGGIGAKIDEVSGTGLYLRRISSNKQLGNLLGMSACRCGAILWKVNGGLVQTKAELEASVESVGISGYTLTLLMFDGTDLSGVNKDKLVRGKLNPRRRNGQPYPLRRRFGGELISNSKSTTQSVRSHDGGGSDSETLDSSSLPSGEGMAKSKSPLQRFLDFEFKFKRLARLDYKDTKIHIKHVMSSLWAKHKELFGATAICDDHCLCVYSMPELCENILDDYKNRQKKSKQPVEARSELESRIPGIMRYFSPRFMSKLRETYEDETPNQLVDRLCDMWIFHTRARQYGVHCSENCQCGEEWDQLFGEGDVQRAEEFWSSSGTSKKRAPIAANDSLPRDSTSNISIPRKKRGVASNPGETTSASSAKLSAPIPRRTAQHETPKRTPVNQTITYEVAFDSSLPLGGYFRTNLSANGLNFVEVHSVCPFGQMAKDRRIVSGTCAVAVLAGENRNEVTTHEDLGHRYEVARRQRRPLKLIFVSQVAHFGRDHDQHCWNNNGDWVGPCADGWAGGALDHTTKRNEPNDAVVSDKVNKACNIEEQKTAQQDTWAIKVHESRLPDLSTRKPTKSSLKLNATKSRSKKVTFSKVCAKKVIFDKDYPSNTEVVRQSSHDVVDVHMRIPSKISSEQCLADAIQKGACKDVVKVLQSGFPLNANLVNTVLKFHYDYLKGERGQLDGDSSPEATRKKADLEAKSMVLKVYINCAYQIEKAMSLTKWYRLQIRVVNVNISKARSTMDNFGRTCGGRVAMRHGSNAISKEILGVLPVMSLQEQISYDRDDTATFAVNNNATFGLEDRELVIELNEGFSDETIPATSLGSVIFKLDELERRCPLDGTWIDAVQPLRDEESGQFAGGDAKISVMKQQVGQEYSTQKRAEILQAFKAQMDIVKKFNNDPTRHADEKISGNIQGINGLSLLHAAIHLGESGPLISAMLDLGVDPRLKSHLGTPLHFAQRQLDRALEKEKNLEAKQAPLEEVNHQREKCKQVRKLVEMLQAASTSSQSLEEHTSVADVEKDGMTGDIDAGEKQDRGVARKTDESQGVSGKAASHNQRRTRERPSSKPSRTEKESGSQDTSRASVDSIPRRRPSLSPTRNFSDGSTSNADRQDKRSSFIPNLPHLPSVAWAPLLNKSDRRCSNNLRGCFHLRSLSCHYWHDVLSPLRPEEMNHVPRGSKTRLPPNHVALKEERHLWTAVFADARSKRFIHAQDVFRKGYTSPQGISWFVSRTDAEAALERTVTILCEIEDPPPPRKHNKNYGNGGRFGRKPL